MEATSAQVPANTKFSIECPNQALCSNTGSYGERVIGWNHDVQWQEVQCEFCYENKSSTFNMANYTDILKPNKKINENDLITLCSFHATGLHDIITLTMKIGENTYDNIPIDKAHGLLVAVFKLVDVVDVEQSFIIVGQGRCLKFKVFDKEGQCIADFREGNYLLFPVEMISTKLVMEVT